MGCEGKRRTVNLVPASGVWGVSKRVVWCGVVWGGVGWGGAGWDVWVGVWRASPQIPDNCLQEKDLFLCVGKGE